MKQKWDFATIEQTLWNAVPKFIRELNELTQQHCEQNLTAQYRANSLCLMDGR